MDRFADNCFNNLIGVRSEDVVRIRESPCKHGTFGIQTIAIQSGSATKILVASPAIHPKTLLFIVASLLWGRSNSNTNAES